MAAVITFWITFSIPVRAVWSSPAVVTFTFSLPVTVGVQYTFVTHSTSWSVTSAALVKVFVTV